MGKTQTTDGIADPLGSLKADDGKTTHERFNWSVLPSGHQGGGGPTGEMSMLLLEEKKL